MSLVTQLKMVHIPLPLFSTTLILYCHHLSCSKSLIMTNKLTPCQCGPLFPSCTSCSSDPVLVHTHSFERKEKHNYNSSRKQSFVEGRKWVGEVPTSTTSKSCIDKERSGWWYFPEAMMAGTSFKRKWSSPSTAEESYSLFQHQTLHYCGVNKTVVFLIAAWNHPTWVDCTAGCDGFLFCLEYGEGDKRGIVADNGITQCGLKVFNTSS